jgi:hypothetical protein
VRKRVGASGVRIIENRESGSPFYGRLWWEKGQGGVGSRVWGMVLDIRLAEDAADSATSLSSTLKL